MVAAQDEDGAGQLRDAAQVADGVSQLHRPGDISGDEHKVLVRNAPAPALADALKVVFPVRAEHVHGLQVAARQMKVPNGKYAHARPS